MFARIATTALTAAALGLAAFTGAAAASASSVDDEFLTNIDAEGIAFDSARAAISDAHLVCTSIAGGSITPVATPTLRATRVWAPRRPSCHHHRGCPRPCATTRAVVWRG